MADKPRNILICSCEDTMPLDAGAVKRACRGATVLSGRQLCRAELDKFRAAADEPLIVGCTQEAPLFAESAGDDADIRYVNIRETAGWSKDAAKAGPKMAALIAAAAEAAPDVPFVSFTSEGVILIYGRDEQAIEAANLLKDHLDIFVAAEESARGEGAASGQEMSELDTVLSKNLEEFDLSVRTANCLKNASIQTVRDLVSKSENEILEIKNFGKKSLEELQELLSRLGLSFGMNRGGVSAGASGQLDHVLG